MSQCFVKIGYNLNSKFGILKCLYAQCTKLNKNKNKMAANWTRGLNATLKRRWL